MNANMNAPAQDSLRLRGVTTPPPVRYLTERTTSTQLAEANGIVPEAVPDAVSRLGFTPSQIGSATHALTLRCREFDGTYHATADQVILFGRLIDDDGDPTDRIRFSARRVANRIAWYGNTTNPKLVVYCESRIKALVASQANPDWLCAGLNGVYGWSQGKDKEDNSIPAENLIPPIDTSVLPVVLLPDSHHHMQVRRAMRGLESALASRFQSVTLAKLPDPTDGQEDWGADDFAARYGPKALELIVKPKELASPISFSPDAARFPDLFTASPPAPRFIIQGILPDEVGVLSATGGMGKTTFMLWLSVHVIAGRPVFGHTVERPGAVLFITGEDDRAIFQWRLRNICDQLNLSDAERLAISEQLHVEDVTQVSARLAESDARGNLSPTDFVDRLISAYEDHDIRLAILDPLASFGPGERFVNDGAQIVIQQARRLRRGLSSAVMLINHVSKTHAQQHEARQHAGRGGTAIGDGCRFEYELQRTPEKDAKQLAIPPGASAYSLYVHKLSHAPRPEVPYTFVRSGWDIQWLAPSNQSDSEKERRRQEQVTRELDEKLEKLVAHMRTLDVELEPVTARSLRASAQIIGVSERSMDSIVAHGIRSAVLINYELPQFQKKGVRTHGLRLAPQKY